MPRTITAIIPAAGKPTNRILQNSNLPDTMIPINGKPVIGYILEDLLSRKITDAVIVLSKADTHTEKYVNHKFANKISLRFIYTAHKRGVGYSIYLAAKHLDPKHGILIYLGDTIYKGPLKLQENTLVVSDQYEESRKWCFVEKNGTTMRFLNKPDTYEGTGKILCGIYYLASGKKFAKSLQMAEKSHPHIELSHILEAYQKQRETFRLVNAVKWYDCGNIENYYAARVDFLRLRNFNKLDYNATTGVITKSSANTEKICQEINWFLNTPDNLKALTPRLLDHGINKDHAYYSMEYYGYQSLADIYLHAHQDLAVWRSILRHIFSVIELFKEHPGRVPLSASTDMYVDKTHARIKSLCETKGWKDLLSLPEIQINGQVYKNVDHYLPLLSERIKDLHKQQDMTFIHGDLCLSNILYDTSSRLIKLVDPRGSFGKLGVYGDIKYDLAKLRHSFDGNYEFIISDLFKLEEPAFGEFSYQVYTDEHHDRLSALFDDILAKAGYSLDDIKLIEALLFVSMIPLHQGEPQRQKAMYVTGVKLLDQAFPTHANPHRPRRDHLRTPQKGPRL
ncbi:phosphotransferase [Candidatus Kaiserbacteria bacterium]|nr:phosphotransferase [Candidatus Kaiserbacteria bacterium]